MCFSYSDSNCLLRLPSLPVVDQYQASAVVMAIVMVLQVAVATVKMGYSMYSHKVQSDNYDVRNSSNAIRKHAHVTDVISDS